MQNYNTATLQSIMRLGALLEELTVARARAGIEKLVHLTPQATRSCCATTKL